MERVDVAIRPDFGCCRIRGENSVAWRTKYVHIVGVKLQTRRRLLAQSCPCHAQPDMLFSAFRYHGEMKRGKPHGTGTKTWPDESEYVGEFSLGKEARPSTTTVFVGWGNYVHWLICTQIIVMFKSSVKVH